MASNPTGADAIVVGAGPNGSIAALELARAGRKVLLIDAGPVLRDALFTGRPDRSDVFALRYQLFRLKLLVKGDRHRAFNKFIDQTTGELYVDRAQHPYVTAPGRDFAWPRVRAVGGRGHLWGRVILRYRDEDLARGGWPVSASELASYYGEVEQLLELHPRTLNPLEQQFADAVAARWPERIAQPNRVAGYAAQPLLPMARLALDTGNVELVPSTVAARLSFRSEREVDGVEVVDAVTGARRTIYAPLVVVAGSAFESVRLLLNSSTPHHPGGLGNHSGLLGTRILEHVMLSVLDELPASHRKAEPEYFHNPFHLNEEPHGFYIPSYLSSDCGTDPYGFGVQGTISANTGMVYVGAFGEIRASDRNRLRVDPAKTDANGIPVAAIDFEWSDGDLALYRRAHTDLGEMVDEFERGSGIKLRNPLSARIYHKLVTDRPVPGSNHESGGARMGTEASTSVTDPYGRVWSAPNVFVCDAALFPSLPPQNPTLTSMALTLRAMREAAGERPAPESGVSAANSVANAG